MPRIYTVPFESIAVSAAQDLVEITPADDKPIEIVSAVFTFADDETNEQLRFTVKHASGAYTSGSGGGSPTNAKTNPLDPSPGFTSERNNTTRATGGTITTVHAEGAPGQAGFAYVPIPGSELKASQGEAIIFGLEAAPGASRNMSGVVYVREFP